MVANPVARDPGLVPYKITLLSNWVWIIVLFALVLVPYKITLLSNLISAKLRRPDVLVPYKITLLSNRPGCPDVL